MKLKLKDVLINPNRDLVRNPFNEEKLAKLTASINKTGFWDNVVVRKNKAGKYEMAYGHHRVEAAKRAGVEEADFIVKNFSDTEMIKVMKDENDEAYGFSAASLLESVRAVVNALAEGRIAPFEISKDTKKSSIRYAPSFIPGGDDGRSPTIVAYTATFIAEFLGETVDRGGTLRANEAIVTTLNALALIETQELSEASLKGLPLDGGKNGNGLVQKVRKKIEEREFRIALKAKQEERTAFDVANRETEKKEKERQAELRRLECEAHKEEDKKEAKRLAEQRKVDAERAEKRAEEFKINRAALDAQVEEAKERAEAAQKQDKGLPTRHAVATCIDKLAMIVSERNSFRENLKTLSRNKGLTQAERERIRQGLLAVAEWYAEQALAFRPVAAVDVLKEARSRETAKHKREEE